MEERNVEYYDSCDLLNEISAQETALIASKHLPSAVNSDMMVSLWICLERICLRTNGSWILSGDLGVGQEDF